MPLVAVHTHELAAGLWLRVIHRAGADPRAAEQLLTPFEKQLFARDRDAARRDLRILARAALREWLGALLHKSANEVPLQTSPTGRLELPPPATWTFSTSTRGDIAVLALARADLGDLGVDVEKMKPDVDVAALAAPAFTAAERARLDAQPQSARAALALRLWVRKEAVAKALGLGVAAFDAGLDLSTLDWAENPTWQDFATLGRTGRLRDLPPPAGSVASVALVVAQ